MLGWLMLILFVILAFIVWISLLNNAKQSKIDFHIEEHAEHQTDPMEEIPHRTSEIDLGDQDQRESPLQTPVADDLTIVEGIGPKVCLVLNQAGIYSYKQLSETEVTRLMEILERAKYTYMDPVTWPDQAKLAAEGRIADLKIFQEQLRAGRR